METGTGALSPDLYYSILHNKYKKSAAVKNKLSFRTLAGVNLYNQTDEAEAIDSALVSRAKIEALNVADRQADIAWVAEGDKVNGQMVRFKRNIDRILPVRPCAVDTGVTLKIPFPSEYSFPSGHTSNGFAGAVTIFSYYRKAGILSLLVAAIIAFSRLYFFVHYPTDILGGMVLGTLDAVLAVYIVKRLEDRVDVKTISDNDKTGHK